MSGNENTKNKLVDTMRKTKEASTAKATESQPKAETKEPAKAAPKKAAPAKPKAKKTSADPFQSSQRVWPD